MADDTSTTTDTTSDADAGAGGDAGESKLSQAEVNRIVGREKAAATRAAQQAVADALGMSVEDAAAALKAKSEADKAQMTEADRKLAEAAEKLTAAAAREADASARERRADIRAALADQNVSSKVAGRLLSLVDAELGADPADADHIAAAIDAVKADLPALFEAPADPAAAVKTVPNGDPRGRPPAGGQATADQVEQQSNRHLARLGLVKTANQSA